MNDAHPKLDDEIVEKIIAKMGKLKTQFILASYENKIEYMPKKKKKKNTDTYIYTYIYTHMYRKSVVCKYILCIYVL